MSIQIIKLLFLGIKLYLIIYNVGSGSSKGRRGQKELAAEPAWGAFALTGITTIFFFLSLHLYLSLT